jgi:hypothetical protein
VFRYTTRKQRAVKNTSQTYDSREILRDDAVDVAAMFKSNVPWFIHDGSSTVSHAPVYDTLATSSHTFPTVLREIPYSMDLHPLGVDGSLQRRYTSPSILEEWERSGDVSIALVG